MFNLITQLSFESGALRPRELKPSSGKTKITVRFEWKYEKDLNSNDMNDKIYQQINISLNLQKLLRNRHSIKRLTHFHPSSERKTTDRQVFSSSAFRS